MSPADVALFRGGKTGDPADKVTTARGVVDGYHAPARNAALASYVTRLSGQTTNEASYSTLRRKYLLTRRSAGGAVTRHTTTAATSEIANSKMNGSNPASFTDPNFPVTAQSTK